MDNGYLPTLKIGMVNFAAGGTAQVVGPAGNGMTMDNMVSGTNNGIFPTGTSVICLNTRDPQLWELLAPSGWLCPPI